MRLFYPCALLLGTAHAFAGTTGRIPSAKNASTIPGAYIVEFADGHVRAITLTGLVPCLPRSLARIQDKETFYESLSISGLSVSPRMDLNFTLFRGASFRFTDTAQERRATSKIASMSAIKQIWPVRRYPVPDAQHQSIIANPRASISIDTSTVNTSDAFPTHVMTQVSKLHALGCK